MKISFLTGNKDKFEEASMIIPDLEQKDIDLEEIQDIDSRNIITHKLQAARKYAKGNLVVEDNGIYFDALNGLPGPLIKWFLKTIGNDGLFKLLEPYENKKASAKVILGLSKEDGTIEFFEGETKGTIVAPRGEKGFGWDPIFLPEGYKKTFGEMTFEEKNKISMRKIAFEALKKSFTS